MQHSREHTCSTFWSKEATGKNETFSGWLYLLYLTTTLVSETEQKKKYLTDSVKSDAVASKDLAMGRAV